ncbi:TonB-dependent receptor [Qipengyuania nanhaisediminis]|uniref:Iron complex outermembrane recepter protein n=1 Tax=Qipengyuania nanhaisediminis TaxID=604088 RepID=A0A1I5NQS9_9SPHN|nr:TonB-dependent receptor [Qipengyuania nanhaisediminis]SFP23666.1 iron complex outermembrane recepter protein [Qipengyuania nanhaisediminis]
MAFRKHLAGTSSVPVLALALVGGMYPSIAAAQDTQPATTVQEEEGQPVDEADEENVIIVSGFREALATAVAQKRNSDLILESVTAEDIGKLPDDSIGESIARLPGVTSQRLNGRANVIAIRGLGPDFSQTLLNGREQTSTGDNRAVEFDQYPSEVVNQVLVYKSPSASLVGQGLVGTIDVRTIRPLETGEQIFAIGAKGSYADLGALNAGSKEFGYRANATYVDQFADDTLGIALSAAYTDEPYQLQEFNAWGYAGNGEPGSPFVIGGSKSFVTSTQLTRIGVNGTLQWQASPTLMVTLDGFYSNFDDDQSKRGIELPLAFGTTFDPNTATVVDGPFGGFAEQGTFENVEGVVRNDVFQREADLYSGGLNLDYEGDDGWSAFFDFGFSRTDRNELSIESYSGTGYNAGVGATDTIQFFSDTEGTSFQPTLDYSDPNQIVLTDPLGWGGSRVQAGYYNNRIIEDELFQYRLGVAKELEGFISKANFGLSYTDRSKSLTPDEFFVMPSGGATELAIPSSALLRPTDLGYLGLGPIVSYDVRDLIADGTLILEANDSNDIPAKAYGITEKLMTAYLQFDVQQDLGAGELTGNFGVQAVNTEQNSTGIAFVDLDGDGGQERVDLSLGDNYWDILPSANLSLRFDSGWVFRLAASRQIQRPQLDDLRVAIGYGLVETNNGQSPTGQYPFIDGSGGNPVLRPYRANAVDFNVEKYFAGGAGVVAAQLFYKDLVSYIDGDVQVFDYSAFPLPAGNPPATTIGLLRSEVNTGGGNFYGAELSATVPFDAFVSGLQGFGATGGVGYTKTEIENAQGNVDQIPGYSKWVANGTLYYDLNGFSARGSVRYRSEFLADFTGFGGNITRRLARAETIVDAQIGYEFQPGSALEGLSIYVQGQNLTNQPFVSQFDVPEPRAVIDYQEYGRRFLAGFTYKF